MSTNDLTTVELGKIRAEIAKRLASTSKLNRKSAWYQLSCSRNGLPAQTDLTRSSFGGF